MSPANGLIVYDTNLGTLCISTSGTWVQASILAVGSSSANQVAFWGSPGILSGNNNLYWNNATSRMGIGTTGPNQQLEITGAFQFPPTTSSTTGVIYKGGTRFMHDYKPAANNGYNTFLGADAGNFTMTGPNPADASNNTGIGMQALSAVTTGSSNSAAGSYALRFNTSGDFNTAAGANAMYSNTSGTGNTAIGEEALYSNMSGNNNTATGMYALYDNGIGNDNTAMGAYTLGNNFYGWENTAFGKDAMNANTAASRNVAVGNEALITQSYANGGTIWYSYNVAVGYAALRSNEPTSSSTGQGNTAVGSSGT